MNISVKSKLMSKANIRILKKDINTDMIYGKSVIALYVASYWKNQK